MTTIPPKLAAAMLSRGNYKSLARASAKKASPRHDKRHDDVTGTHGFHNCTCDGAAALERLVEAATLKRNTMIEDAAGLFGKWVAVPAQDFHWLRFRLQPFRERREGE